MAALTIAKDQYVEMWSKLIHHVDALHSLRWGGADIATLRRSRADLRQVQPAHELALEKLVALLDDQDKIETVHAKFCAVGNSADKLSKEVLELMEEDVRIVSFSQANYSLRCWDSTWQNTITKLTAIRDALQKKDIARTLLR